MSRKLFGFDRKLVSTLVIAILGVLCLFPELPRWRAVPPWAALVLGVVVALSLGNPHLPQTRAWTSKLLAWSVMGLGAAMNLGVVARVGLQGLGLTMAGILLTLLMGNALGNWLKVRKSTALLVSVGTAICGGSAIAATAAVLRADEEDTSLALATVFLLNAAALIIFPLVGQALHLGQRPFGLWAALAIHDTSSVVGASSAYGAEALLVATTTKLARALWIVPVTLVLGYWVARRKGQETSQPKAKRPWFILGFLLAAALVTYFPVLRPAGGLVTAMAKRCLVLTLFLLGLGLSQEALRKVGFRPFFHGLLL